MHSLEYTFDWANLVVGQLIASHRAISPELWGYACFCIGSQFDAFIAEHYYEIDYVVGDHLHVFTLLPPPKNLLDERIGRLMRVSDGRCDDARQRLEVLRQKWYSPLDKDDLQRERAVLLSELRGAGVKADMETDFLFFDFRRVEEPGAVDIDLVAAEQSPLKDGAATGEYFKLFKQMAEKAAESYERGDTVDQFASSLKWRWSVRIALSRTLHLKEFVSLFSATTLHGVK